MRGNGISAVGEAGREAQAVTPAMDLREDQSTARNKEKVQLQVYGD
ncbi:hypothetical protein [Paenibacillus lautus]|nr:hypothetical protein [Paenibacillus lautus]